jgi:hypothetical protein
VEYRPNKNTSNIIYTYKYIQNMYPKVVLEGKNKGKGTEERKIANNNDTHNICVGTRHKETH